MELIFSGTGLRVGSGQARCFSVQGPDDRNARLGNARCRRSCIAYVEVGAIQIGLILGLHGQMDFGQFPLRPYLRAEDLARHFETLRAAVQSGNADQLRATLPCVVEGYPFRPDGHQPK